VQKALEECDAATKGPGRTRCCHQKVANTAGAAEAAGTPLKPNYILSKQFQNAVLAQRRTKSAAPDALPLPMAGVGGYPDGSIYIYNHIYIHGIYIYISIHPYECIYIYI